MENTLSLPSRAALIGYGMAGRTIHGRLLREAGWQVSVVLVNNEERREQATSDWPGVTLVRTLDELVAVRDQLDVVVIASPTAMHKEHVDAMLVAGIPTVVDKPLGISAAQCQEMVDLADQTGTPLTVFQNRRWDTEQLTLRALLEQGVLGNVHTFERRWERWRPVGRARWKETDTIGGGLLLDLGAHLVDSSVQLFGPVTRVFAQARAMTTAAIDDVFITLEHEGDNGVIFSRLNAGSIVGAPGPRTRVLGDGGSYVVTTFEQETTPFSYMDTEMARHIDGPHEGWLAHGDKVAPVPAAPGGHADFYRAVARWLAGAEGAPVDPRDAVYTAKILDAAKVSSAEHRVVEL